jgi:DNA-binding CsgD family transcriptional regulator
MHEHMSSIREEITMKARKVLHRKRLGLPSTLILSPGYAVDLSQATYTNVVDYVQYAVNLLHLGQTLCGQAHGTAQQFCQEVAEHTHEQVQLSLHNQGSIENAQQILASDSLISFPIRFSDQVYGTLHIKLDSAHPTYPVIPPIGAYLLAYICGWVLYTLKISAFLQTQYQHLSHQACEPLTKREQEVLHFMCCGYNRETIAHTLSITLTTIDTHRQHIYQKLHVHNEHDMLLAGFRAGLFSPIESL